MADEIKVHGLDELDRAFKELEVTTSSKILRSSLHWASKPLHEDMKKNTPTDETEDYLKKSGWNKHAMPSQTKRWLSRDGDSEMSATVNVGYRMNKVWYVPLKGFWFISELEFGTSTKAPLGWMRRAAERQWKVVAERFSQRVAWRIKKLEKTGK